MKKTPINKVRILTPDGPTIAEGIFKGQASGVLNWDEILYPKFYKVFRQLLANFWKPDDVSMVDDLRDFPTLSPKVQETFATFSVMLSVLDSVQSHTLSDIQRYVSDTATKHILANLNQQETIHTQCYSYMNSSLLRSETVSKLFETLLNSEHVQRRNMPIVEAYEAFSDEPTVENLFKVLVHSTNLEGIYFVAAFVFFFSLARQNKMMGSATMISYIQRDEMVHYDFIANLLRILMNEYPHLNTPENVKYIYDTVSEAVEAEKDWAYHILDPIADELDIDMDEYEEYIEYLANKRLRLLGVDNLYPDRKNVMPWIHTFDEQSTNKTKTDQFEKKPRTYGKAGVDNGFDEL